MPKRVGFVRTFLKLNNGLGHVVIQLKKVRTSPTRLGVRAFQSCQGVWHYMWVFRVQSGDFTKLFFWGGDHTVAVGQIRAVGIRPIIKDRGWVSIEKDSRSARRAERSRQRQARPW